MPIAGQKYKIYFGWPSHHGKQALDADMWAASKPWVEKGIQKFNEFLARPEVRKTLKAMKLDNPYKCRSSQCAMT